MSDSVDTPVVAAEQPTVENPVSTGDLVDSGVPMEPTTEPAPVGESEPTTEEAPLDSVPVEEVKSEQAIDENITDTTEKWNSNAIPESVTESTATHEVKVEEKEEDKMEVDVSSVYLIIFWYSFIPFFFQDVKENVAAVENTEPEASVPADSEKSPASLPVTAAVNDSKPELSNNKKSDSPAIKSESKKPPKQIDLAKLSIRQYLDSVVVPHLLKGLSSVARERPAKPLEFLGNYLLECSKEESASGE